MLAAHRFIPAPSVLALRPDQVGTLNAWWKADALALSDGDPIGSWADSSGNGHTMTQATGSKKPTYRAAPTGFNGQPAAEFTQAGQSELNAAYSAGLNPSTVTVAIVFEYGTWTGNGQGLITGGQDGAGNGWKWFLSGAQFPKPAFDTVAGGSETNNGDVGVSLTAGGLPVAVLATVPNNTSPSIHRYINGDNSAETFISDGNAWTVSTTGATTLGYSSSGFPLPMAGLIAEAAIWSTVLTADEIAGVQAYFAAKYGL